MTDDPIRIELLDVTGGLVKELVSAADLKPVNDADPDPIELPENAVLREDRNRELRSMLLSVHPCPPLPQIALGGLYKDDRVFSSHDFLATAIDRMLVKRDSVFDSQRRDKQHALVVAFFRDLRLLCAPDVASGIDTLIGKPDETVDTPVDKPDEIMGTPIDKPDETVDTPVDKPDETVDTPVDKPDEIVDSITIVRTPTLELRSVGSTTSADDEVVGSVALVPEVRSVGTTTIAGVMSPLTTLLSMKKLVLDTNAVVDIEKQAMLSYGVRFARKLDASDATSTDTTPVEPTSI
ncbi:hypothetical protein T484DRAFT_1757787, partial [Baffinella frigidus]